MYARFPGFQIGVTKLVIKSFYCLEELDGYEDFDAFKVKKFQYLEVLESVEAI